MYTKLERKIEWNVHQLKSCSIIDIKILSDVNNKRVEMLKQMCDDETNEVSKIFLKEIKIICIQSTFMQRFESKSIFFLLRIQFDLLQLEDFFNFYTNQMFFNFHWGILIREWV